MKTFRHIFGLVLSLLALQGPSLAWHCAPSARCSDQAAEEFCAQACTRLRQAESSGQVALREQALCGGFSVQSIQAGLQAQAHEALAPVQGILQTFTTLNGTPSPQADISALACGPPPGPGLAFGHPSHAPPSLA